MNPSRRFDIFCISSEVSRRTVSLISTPSKGVAMIRRQNPRSMKKSLFADKTRAAAVCVFVNLFLTVLKLVYGIVCSVPSLIADGFHSAADLCSSVIVFAGIRIASRRTSAPPDDRRYACAENTVSVILSSLLFFTAIRIGYGGVYAVFTGDHRGSTLPSAEAIAVSILAVLLKFLLAYYLQRVARKTASLALKADAVHQLSDALASLTVAVSIPLTMLGISVADPIASVTVSLFLARASVGIFRDAVKGS